MKRPVMVVLTLAAARGAGASPLWNKAYYLDGENRVRGVRIPCLRGHEYEFDARGLTVYEMDVLLVAGSPNRKPRGLLEPLLDEQRRVLKEYVESGG